MERAIKAANLKRNSLILGLCYRDFANFYTQEEQYDKALYYNIGLLESEDEIRCRKPCVLNNIGDLYMKVGNFHKAKHMLLEAISQAAEEDHDYKAVIFQNLGEIEIHFKNYERAKSYIERALSSAKYTQNPEHRKFCCYLILFEIALEQWDISLSNKLYRECMEYFQNREYEIKYYRLQLGYGQLLMKEERFQEADEIFAQCMEFYQRIDHKKNCQMLYRVRLQIAKFLNRKDSYLLLLDNHFQWCQKVSQEVFENKEIELKFENVWLKNESQKNIKRQRAYEILKMVGKHIQLGETKREMFHELYQLLNRWMEVPIMWIGCLEKKDTLVYRYVIEMNEERPPVTVDLKEKKSIASHVFQSAETLLLQDLSSKEGEEILHKVSPNIYYNVPESIICLPLIVQNQFVGIWSLQSGKKGSSFAEEQTFLEELSPYIGMMVVQFSKNQEEVLPNTNGI